MSGLIEQIAKVEYARLGWEDHGILTVLLGFTFGDSGQGISPMCLDEYDKATKQRVGTAFGLEYVMRIMQAFGVLWWEDIPRRTIFALRDGEGFHGMIRGLRPLPTEGGKEFIFQDIVDKYHPERAKSAV